jgi:hypothetical protein
MSAIYIHRETRNKHIVMSGKKDMMSGKNIMIRSKKVHGK